MVKMNRVQMDDSTIIYLKDSDLTTAEKKAIIRKALDNCTFRNLAGDPIVYVPTSVLALDLSYQRDPREDTAKVAKLVRNWDNSKFMPLSVAYRNGKLYVDDGGHRNLGAVQRGIEEVPVVVQKRTQQQSAAYFQEQNVEDSPLQPWDKYRAGLVAKDSTSLTIQRICNHFGLKVTRQRTNVSRPMKAIKAAMDIVKSKSFDGSKALYWMFDIMDKARWTDLYPIKAMSARFMNSLAPVYQEAMQKGEGAAYAERLEAVFHQYDPDTISAFALLRHPNGKKSDARMPVKVALLDIARGSITADDIAAVAEKMAAAKKKPSKKAKKVA